MKIYIKLRNPRIETSKWFTLASFDQMFTISPYFSNYLSMGFDFCNDPPGHSQLFPSFHRLKPSYSFNVINNLLGLTVRSPNRSFVQVPVF